MSRCGVIPNNNKTIKLRIHMRRVNSAILRERHSMPTIDELLPELNGVE